MKQAGLIKEFNFAEDIDKFEMKYQILSKQIILSSLTTEQWKKIEKNPKTTFKDLLSENKNSDELCSIIQKIASWYSIRPGYFPDIDEVIYRIENNITPSEEYLENNNEPTDFTFVLDKARCKKSVTDAFFFLISNEIIYPF